MTLKEILAGGGVGLVLLLSLVQISPIKFNPWTAIARAIGKAINGTCSMPLPEEIFLDGHSTSRS